MEKWFNKTGKEVEEILKTNMKEGLNENEIKERQERY